jgi:Protein of unknown function (DUF4235)
MGVDEEDTMAGSRLWKIFGLVSAAVATVATHKVLETGWRAATGTTPPKNPEHPDVTFGEALGWAIASGATMGVARMLATRRAADYWRRSTGRLPPGFEEIEE